MFERFAAAARDAVFLAIGEAGRRGDRRVGTDHLLIGVLHDPALADEMGSGPDAARRAADDLDREALAAIGFDPDLFGALHSAPKAARLPFTPGTKAVLKRTLALAQSERSRRIESRHLLSALLERDSPDPAAEIVARLRIDRR